LCVPEHLRDLLRVPCRRVVDGDRQLVQTDLGRGRPNLELVLELQRGDPASDRYDGRPGDTPGHLAYPVDVVAVQRDNPGAAGNSCRGTGELPADLDVERVIHLKQRGLLFVLGRVEHLQARDVAVQDAGGVKVGDWSLECARPELVWHDFLL